MLATFSTLVLLGSSQSQATLTNLSPGDSGVSIRAVEKFPPLASDWSLLPWKDRSDQFLDLVLRPAAQGEYLPLFWWDDTQIWEKKTTFGLPSFIGMKGQWQVFRNAHEAIVTSGTVLSGALIGRDMTQVRLPGNSSAVDLVGMQSAYFSPTEKVFLDGIGSKSGQSFWYDLFPNILVGALVAKYPDQVDLSSKWENACRQWLRATNSMAGGAGFNHQGFEIATNRPFFKTHRETDAPAGLAYLLLGGYGKTKDPKLLEGAKSCLDALQKIPVDENPNYEILTAFGVYAASRINAEHQGKYDVSKLANWCFDPSYVRGRSPNMPKTDLGDRYGVIGGVWGKRPVAGLVGASHYTISEKTGPSGYGFGFDTFAYAWPLVAAVRYEPRLANSVGKWMSHAVDSVRLTYPDQISKDKQTCFDWASKNTFAIPYEGLMERDYRTGEPGPFAAGDPLRAGWGPLDLSVYSGSLVGVFGALIKPSPNPKLLRLSLNATDFHALPSYPTELFYNADAIPVKVPLAIGPDIRLYNLTNHQWVAKAGVTLAPGEAIVIVETPAKYPPVRTGGKLTVNNIVVDHGIVPLAAEARSSFTEFARRGTKASISK